MSTALVPSPVPVFALDAGNTRIKWGLNVGGRWIARGALANAQGAKLGRDWPPVPPGTRTLGSNVGGERVKDHLYEACARHRLLLDFIASRDAQLGVTSGYREPGQLGPDRWAALLAAHAAGAAHQLVVNAGTALTVDALRADGRFLGGIIVPGPALMRRSLGVGTAKLKRTEGRFEPFPACTPDAITSGALQAAAGAVARMAQTMTEAGCPPARIVLSGGAAPELAPLLPMAPVVNDNLVLDGIALIARNP